MSGGEICKKWKSGICQLNVAALHRRISLNYYLQDCIVAFSSTIICRIPLLFAVLHCSISLTQVAFLWLPLLLLHPGLLHVAGHLPQQEGIKLIFLYQIISQYQQCQCLSKRVLNLLISSIRQFYDMGIFPRYFSSYNVSSLPDNSGITHICSPTVSTVPYILHHIMSPEKGRFSLKLSCSQLRQEFLTSSFATVS